MPDGASLELFSARPTSTAAQGAQHWRGHLRGGVWQIEAASPAVDAGTLVEALALAEAAESGRRLRVRDGGEAERILARVQRALGDRMGSNALLHEGEEVLLRRRDKLLFERIAARVFWMRYARQWPLNDQDLA